MRNWERPMTVVDTFVANEFVSACGDKNKEYLFKCDAGDGVYGSVYKETNGVDGLQTRGWNRDEQIADYNYVPYLGESGFHACGTEHVAKHDSGFYPGYYCAKGNTNKPVQVIIWRGNRGNNVHCTTHLNMNEWTTVKS